MEIRKIRIRSRIGKENKRKVKMRKWSGTVRRRKLLS